jgi:hypothetical protein
MCERHCGTRGDNQLLPASNICDAAANLMDHCHLCGRSVLACVAPCHCYAERHGERGQKGRPWWRLHAAPAVCQFCRTRWWQASDTSLRAMPSLIIHLCSTISDCSRAPKAPTTPINDDDECCAAVSLASEKVYWVKGTTDVLWEVLII